MYTQTKPELGLCRIAAVQERVRSMAQQLNPKFEVRLADYANAEDGVQLAPILAALYADVACHFHFRSFVSRARGCPGQVC